MLSPIVPYSLYKMHWNPEHAQSLSQWPEQHLDVSSTTSSPAHKSELYATGRTAHGRGGYAWANDDISALTASNLLKRYAENHSAEGPYTGSLDGLSGPKPGTSSAGPPGTSSNLSDSGYSGSSSCSGDYNTPSYNGPYLSSNYCPPPTSALTSAPLHHPLQPTPTMVPSYSPSTPGYNYHPGGYPHQATLASSYAHPSAGFLPPGLATPSPLPSRPTRGRG
ncbi:hypothetical protein UPYG_G00003890 [Umbra pygmaea]|uniref:Uncharacterized protein n=1 Tax=Umbra pygmaea TaxID=75934 RepID=A0ABD0XYA0_UMBPY